MRPGYALGAPMGISSNIATLEYTSNGIMVHYQEAVRRRTKNASPLAGMDMSYFSALFEMIAAQMGGGEDWDNDKKKERMERMRDILKSAKAPTEDKYTEQWIAEHRSIFCKDLTEVPAAIAKSHEAYLGILSIMREGDHVMPDSAMMF